MKVNTLLLLLFFNVSLFFNSCIKQKENLNININGVWIQEGYGRILLIKDSIYTYYNTTESSCLPLIENGVLTDRFSLVELKDNNLILNPGGIVDYRFKRTSILPEKCESINLTLDHSPQNNFNVLWNTFNSHYAFFNERGIDWNEIKEQSDSRLKNIKSDKQLYDYFTDIFKPFNDGHIKLDVPDSLITLKNFIRDSKNIKTKDEVIKDILSNYVSNVESYNKGTVQWGILNGENIGYLVITDMNNFSNYISDTDLSKSQFWDEYDNILETKSGLEHLNDELKGVDYIMEKILNDFSKTESVIIDLRFNGGGYETVALKTLSHFVNEPKHILSIKAKKGDGYTEEQKYILYPSKNQYKGRVSLLTSYNTASAAEIFVLGAKAYPQIKRFGSSTNGVFSEILWKNLPNGWEFSLSNEVYSDPNGNTYETTGIPVNYEIEYSKNRALFFNSFYRENEIKDVGIEKIITFY